MVAVIVFDRPAMANFFPLWMAVHGEWRLELPVSGELEALLRQLGIECMSTDLPATRVRSYESFEEALDECGRRLFLGPGDPKLPRLREALEESLMQADSGLRLRWAELRRPSLFVWFGFQAEGQRRTPGR